MIDPTTAMLLAITGCAVALYATVSSALLRYPPKRFRKRNMFLGNCVHISHRGGAGESLENTIAAFDHAIECGTNMLEIDCHLTADGEIVVAHDADLMRLAGTSGTISACRYADLPKLATNVLIDFEAGKSFTCDPFGDRRIPTLREVMERYPDVVLNVDAKSQDPKLVESIYKLVHEFKREPITVVGNFSNFTTSLCYQMDSQVPIMFSASRVLLLVVLYYSGLLPFIPLRESCLEMPMPSVIDRSRTGQRIGARYRFIARLVNRSVCRPGLVKHLRRRGIEVFPWVLNDETQWREAFEMGATGVMTDYPTRLRKFLDANPGIRKVF